MGDPDDVSGDPEFGARAEDQGRGQETNRFEQSVILDAEAILRKLDMRSPGLMRASGPEGAPSSFSALRPGGGTTMVGSLPAGLGQAGNESEDRDPELDTETPPGRMFTTMTNDGEAGGAKSRIRGGTAVANPGGISGGPATTDRFVRMDVAEFPIAGQGASVSRSSGFVSGEAGPAIRPEFPTRTIPIRDAFPPGLREDADSPRSSVGTGADQGPRFWEGSAWGDPIDEGVGSRHGVAAEDLLKTNELLRQLVEETKRQRVASLPTAGPKVYPGR